MLENMIMEISNLRSYAHIGDAVWELFVREFTVYKTQNLKTLHKLTTDRVKSSYQAEMLIFINDFLTENEHDIARRARNCSIPVARKNNQSEYRLSTAFEALIGFWYLNDKTRLENILDLIKKEFFYE